MSTTPIGPTELETMGRPPSRLNTNRVLIWLALLGIVLGALLGQALLTWLNATLL